jgi:hypothetical protein
MRSGALSDVLCIYLYIEVLKVSHKVAHLSKGKHTLFAQTCVNNNNHLSLHNRYNNNSIDRDRAQTTTSDNQE